MNWTIDITQIELLAKCNLKCRHCSNATQNESKEIASVKVKEIVNQLTEHGVKVIVLSGGEPFLYQSIQEIVDYIYNRNINVQINTNGVLLQNHIGWLQKYKHLLTLQISMDGYDADTYKFIRQSDCFENVIQNIRSATAIGINVELKTVFSKKTASHYKSFQILSKELNVPISYGYIARQGRAIDNEEICLSQAEMIENYQNMVADGIPTVQRGLFKADHCPLIFSPGTIGTMRITNEGDCYPCIGFSGRALTLGNIYECSIKQMLDNYNEYRKLLLDMLYNDKCFRCGARKKSPRPGCIVSCKYFGDTKCIHVLEGDL